MSIRGVSSFPITDIAEPTLPSSGLEVKTPEFCRRQFGKCDRCADFYRSLADKADGFHECPFGFGCFKFTYLGQWVWTSLILFPRFGSPSERERARQAPDSKVSRDVVARHLRVLMEFEKRLSDEYEQKIKDTPPAFHELRKLNRTIKQGAERLRETYPHDDQIRRVHGASELLSNQFDILELLATEEILNSPPTHSKQLEAIIYKCAKILEERAIQKGMSFAFRLNQGTAIVHPKSFPIVPSVLIDNAIRYGNEGTAIVLGLDWFGAGYRLWVENRTDVWLPRERLFRRGSRLLAPDGEGSGLGLYLVQQVAMQHGGTVLFEQASGVVRFGIEGCRGAPQGNTS